MWHCNLCGVEGTGVYGLTTHTIVAHSRINKQCDCGYQFNNSTELVRHMKESHTSLRFSCDLCGKQFHNEVMMQIHIENHRQ